jgi:uncharacterized repeat protein (TIGR03803 family)
VNQAPAITQGVPNISVAAKTQYSTAIQTTGYPTPTISLTAGSIPTGMTLSSTGVFSGVPTQAGTFTGTITASNGIGTPATQNFSLTVLANPLQQYTILHQFQDGSVAHDGADPAAALVVGNDGNFYGTTTSPYSGGTVFKMTPQGVVTVLHNFGDGSVPNDGSFPLSLVQGTDGNFYGVTQYGGANGLQLGSLGYGTIFKMTPQGTVTILYNFTGSTDGAGPTLLIQGWDGNFYGATSQKIFKLTPAGIFSVVTTFPSAINGYGVTSLVQGFDGNFYGTTNFGGVSTGFGYGTVFQMTPQGTLTFLHNFNDGSVANDGIYPNGLTQALDGNFYGTSQGGGAGQEGFQDDTLGRGDDSA